MKIIVDQEGKKAVEFLCDSALRKEGLKNMLGIQKILDCVEDIPEESKES